MLTVALIGLVGGVITGIFPCVLPVLPVVFLSGGAQAARPARTRRSLVTAGGVAPAEPDLPAVAGRRPYLVVAGLALSFSLVTLLGTLLGTLALAALPVPQDAIRWTGLALLVLLGIGMIAPPVERLAERPFARIPRRSAGTDRGSFVLGLALGAVYVPCAGPVLAAITVAGAPAGSGPRP